MLTPTPFAVPGPLAGAGIPGLMQHAWVCSASAHGGADGSSPDSSGRVVRGTRGRPRTPLLSRFAAGTQRADAMLIVGGSSNPHLQASEHRHERARDLIEQLASILFFAKRKAEMLHDGDCFNCCTRLRAAI